MTLTSTTPDLPAGARTSGLGALRRLADRLESLEQELTRTRATRAPPEQAAMPAAEINRQPERPPTDEDVARYAAAEELAARGMRAEAIQVLATLVKSGVIMWEAYNDYGALLLASGDRDAAIEALRVAASLDIVGTVALRNLVAAYADAGETGQVIAGVRILMKREPDDPDIVEFLADVIRAADVRFDELGWISARLAGTGASLKKLLESDRIIAAQREEARLLARFFREARADAKTALAALQPSRAALEFPALRFSPLPERRHPSIILFLPPATASLSVSRILTRLYSDHYEIVSPEYGLWAAGLAANGAPEFEFEPEGKIYWWFTAERMKNALSRAHLDLAEFKTLFVLRDPRDSVVSLYHLTQNPDHLEKAKAVCSPEMYEESVREAATIGAQGLDAYARERTDWWVGNIAGIREMLALTPPHQACCLSYALLCEDFPRFVARLVGFMGGEPAADILGQVLETEDVKRKDTLNRDSLAHSASASPLPGRHRRELRPETIACLNDATREMRRWMAMQEEPFLRHLYAD